MGYRPDRGQCFLLNDKYPTCAAHDKTALAVTAPRNDFACACGKRLSLSFCEQQLNWNDWMRAGV